jgi:hypothetical protein
MFETEDTGGEDEDEGVELPRPNCRLLFLPQHRTPSVVEPSKQLKFDPETIWLCVNPLKLVVAIEVGIPSAGVPDPSPKRPPSELSPQHFVLEADWTTQVWPFPAERETVGLLVHERHTEAVVT